MTGLQFERTSQGSIRLGWRCFVCGHGSVGGGPDHGLRQGLRRMHLPSTNLQRSHLWEYLGSLSHLLQRQSRAGCGPVRRHAAGLAGPCSLRAQVYFGRRRHCLPCCALQMQLHSTLHPRQLCDSCLLVASDFCSEASTSLGLGYCCWRCHDWLRRHDPGFA